MPQRKRVGQSGATGPVMVHPSADETKPDVRQLGTSFAGFQPFSRIHRAKLHDLFANKPGGFTVAFCHIWASEHDVDPASVLDWVERRSMGESRRVSSMLKTHDPDSVQSPNVFPSSASEIRVKRERAASPVLSESEPAKKKAKGRHSGPETASATNTFGTIVRHTRAHNQHPHPACPTCTLSTDVARTPVAAVGPTMMGTASDTWLPPTATTIPSSTIPLAPRPAIKSALRVSTPGSTARVPRRVRFSRELYNEALIAYSRLRPVSPQKRGRLSPGNKSDDIYVAVSMATVDVSAVATQSATLESRGTSGLDFQHSPQLLDADVRSGSSATAKQPSIDTQSAGLSATGTGAGPVSPAAVTPSRRGVHPVFAASLEKRMLNAAPLAFTGLSPRAARLATSRPAPEAGPVTGSTLGYLGVSQHFSSGVYVPRTPTPSRSTGPDSRSFFSPSFFSSDGFSSGEEEVEALLTSSPPTSPLHIPHSSLPCNIVSPSPKRVSRVSVAARLECISTNTPGSVPPPATIYPSIASPLPPNAEMSVVSPSRNEVLLPADIPPRTRTPPNSGPIPGSKPNTPQPARPPRPASQLVVLEISSPSTEYATHVEGAIEVPFPPRARTPPCPPGGGSRQCTPDPARPVRPSADQVVRENAVDTLRVLRREEEEDAVDVRQLRREEEEDEEEVGRGVVSTRISPLVASSLLVPWSVYSDSPKSVPSPGNLVNVPLTAIEFPTSNVRGSHCASPLPPADIPPRVRTPPGPGGNAPGSRQGTPKPVRPARPGADADVRVQLLAYSHSNGEGNALPFPPRARTPPGPPGGGSRPCTPEPSRPLRPSAVGHVDAAAQDTAITLDEPETPAVKIEENNAGCTTTVWTPGEVLVFTAEEDDEPLAIVLARRKATRVVKTEPVEHDLEANQTKKRSRKASGTPRGKGKGKAAEVVVKTEPVGITAVPDSASAKKKRPTKPKAGKKVKAESAVEVKLEDITSSASAPSASRKPRKKRVPKVATLAGTADGSSSTLVVEKPKRSGRKSAAQATDNPVSPDKSGTAATDSSTIQIRVSLARTPSLQGAESYKGNKHPPRTFTYLPEDLHALGTVTWEASGFECMELSALPWLAGVAQNDSYSNSASPSSELAVRGPVSDRFPSGREYEIIFGESIASQPCQHVCSQGNIANYRA
ncbi:hypothetical protein C8Q77DRAFT_1213354 [Trametes polyzona]|nr:hypothetical protein C8Q77DRAFT_1213354 [Trametes polyzona]